MLARYLIAELSCEVGAIGIQAQDTSLGAPVSPPVRRAIGSVCRGLTTLLLEAQAPGTPGEA